MRSGVDAGLAVRFRSISSAVRMERFDSWYGFSRELRPRRLGMATTSSSFRSQSRRPSTWAQSLFAQLPSVKSTSLPARQLLSITKRFGLKLAGLSRERSASQAWGDAAFHSDSIQGSFRGSSPRSTAPRLLVNVQRLQSYSKAAQAARRSCSVLIHACHSFTIAPESSEVLSASSAVSSSVVLQGELSKPMPRRLPIRIPRDRSAFW